MMIQKRNQERRDNRMAERINPRDMQRGLFALKFGSMVLGDKIVLVLSMLLNFSLFAYATIYPDFTRFATAGLFSITVFMPILLYGRRKADVVQKAGEEREEAA